MDGVCDLCSVLAMRQRVLLCNPSIVRKLYKQGSCTRAGSVAQSDARSTVDQECVSSRLRSGNILSLRLIMKSFLRSFWLPSADSRREVVSYLRKNVHWVLVNSLIGLSLPRKSLARLTDRPNWPSQHDLSCWPWTLSNNTSSSSHHVRGSSATRFWLTSGKIFPGKRKNKSFAGHTLFI